MIILSVYNYGLNQTLSMMPLWIRTKGNIINGQNNTNIEQIVILMKIIHKVPQIGDEISNKGLVGVEKLGWLKVLILIFF
jgi:hypothetical protein